MKDEIKDEEYTDARERSYTVYLSVTPEQENNNQRRNETLADNNSNYQASHIVTQQNNDQARALINYKRNTKSTITQNNLKLIIILNFIPLIGIGYSQYQCKWYLIGKDAFYQYYVNQLFIGIVSVGDIVQERVELLLIFQSNDCNYNVKLCDTISTFVLSGAISFIMIFLGILLHIFSILQLTLLVRAKLKRVVKCMSPMNVQLLILFLYISALVYWFFASGLFTAIGDFGKFVGSLGFIVLVYFLSIVFYVMLMAYFRYVFRKGRKNAMVNKLLHAEQALLQQLPDAGNDDASSK